MAQTRVVVDVARHAAAWRTLPGVTALVRKAAVAAVRGSGRDMPAAVEIAIALADDAQVRDANRDWRQSDKPTNVLSFPANAPYTVGEASFLGDVILAHETIMKEAQELSRPVLDHVTHLVVHGTLHLLGFDHLETAEAEAMEALETRLLAGLGVPDPYAGSTPALPGDA